MSSTQHQLIEQCATRLRGIVEALDNIHENTPLRWSTDLDDVHSSAESLLALINDQAPVRSEASFEEWLANELEGEDGQPVPAAVCDIALARRAFNHWPKLEQPANVGGVRFSAGVSSRLVVEAAQRLYEFESTPEKEAERIERLQAFREQLDPLNLAPHAEAFNEDPDESLRPEQAEAERPEVVAWQYRVTAGPQTGWSLWHPGKGEEFERSYTVERRPLMTVAQHERIVEARRNRAMDLMGEHVARISDKLTAERDAALARVAELTATRNRYGVDAHYFNKNLQRILRDFESFTPDELARSLIILAKVADEKVVAQAQHSVPAYVSYTTRPAESLAGIALRQLKDESRWVEIRDINAHAFPDMQSHNYYPVGTMIKLPSPSNPIPQAWLDVQAERRRQVEAEGWTPEHDDAHSHGEMARAAACYALAGSSAPNDGTAALLVSLAWPWDEQWWKPSTARRDMVKACALALAEIERLDRAAASQGGPSDA
ncbi:TPA: hypothetical protein ACKPZN_001704 [Pseudomonas aeruginosa]